MVFMFALLVVQVVSLVLSYQALRRASTGEESIAAGGLRVLPVITVALLLSLPLLLEIGRLNRFETTGLDAGPYYTPAILLAIGAHLGIAVFGIRLGAQKNRAHLPFLALGPNMLGLLASCYLAFVALDQARFFLPNKDTVGVVSWDLVRELAPEVKDVQCDSDMLLVHDATADIVVYRCPQGVQLVLGRHSPTPLVAWPGYTEGESKQLGSAMRAFHQQAKQNN